jgi:hypothetical protein
MNIGFFSIKEFGSKINPSEERSTLQVIPMETQLEQSRKRKSIETSLSHSTPSLESTSRYRRTWKESDQAERPSAAKKPRGFDRFHPLPASSTTLLRWDMSYPPDCPVQEFPNENITALELQGSQQWISSTASNRSRTQTHSALNPNFWPSLNFINPEMEQGMDYLPTISEASNFEPGSGILSIPRNETYGLAGDPSSDVTKESTGKRSSSTDMFLC